MRTGFANMTHAAANNPPTPACTKTCVGSQFILRQRFGEDAHVTLNYTPEELRCTLPSTKKNTKKNGATVREALCFASRHTPQQQTTLHTL